MVFDGPGLRDRLRSLSNRSWPPTNWRSRFSYPSSSRPASIFSNPSANSSQSGVSNSSANSLPSSIFSNPSVNSSTSSLGSDGLPRRPKSVHWSDHPLENDADTDRRSVEQKGFKDVKDIQEKRKQALLSTSAPEKTREEWKLAADEMIQEKIRTRAAKGLPAMTDEAIEASKADTIGKMAERYNSMKAAGVDPEYQSALTWRKVEGTVRSSYEVVRRAFRQDGQSVTEADVQSIARVVAADDITKEFGSNTTADLTVPKSAATAGPVPRECSVKYTNEEEKDSTCREAAIKSLRSFYSKLGATATDEELRKEYDQSRYHTLDADNPPNERIRGLFEVASKPPEVQPFDFESDALSAEMKTKLGKVRDELDALEASGASMDVIRKRARNLCLEIAPPAWTQTANGVKINTKVLEAFDSVTAEMPWGEKVTFTCLSPTPLDPSNSAAGVSTAGTNPFIATAADREVYKAKYEPVRARLAARVKKAEEEASRRREEAMRITPISLPSADSPPKSFTKWACGGQPEPTDAKRLMMGLSRANEAYSIATQCSSKWNICLSSPL